MLVGMTMDTFEPSNYTSPPRMTLEGGIALGRALVVACPPKMPARIHKAAQKLAAATDKAQEKLAARQKALGAISDEDTRLIDQAGDASWSALRARVNAYAMLPVDEYPDAKRATELVTILFGDQGLSFLLETYPVQWTTADTILKRIDAEGLAADIDRIAGSDFLANARKRHAKYGAMVTNMLIKAEVSQIDLSAEIRTLGNAIVAYATKVCAHVEEDDLDTVTLARGALRPIDAHREANAAHGKGSGASANPAPGASEGS